MLHKLDFFFKVAATNSYHRDKLIRNHTGVLTDHLEPVRTLSTQKVPGGLSLKSSDFLVALKGNHLNPLDLTFLYGSRRKKMEVCNYVQELVRKK